MGGVKGKSGRRRKSPNRADAMRSLTNKLPMAIDVLIETADGHNKDRLRYEAAIQIKDSVIGRPPQSIDARITAKRIYSPEELQLMSGPVLNEAQLLKEWSEDAVKQDEEPAKNEDNQVAQATLSTAED